MASARSRLASLLVSLALHGGLIALAAGVLYSVREPGAAIPVSILTGGGGGAEVASAPAPVAAVPAPPARKVEAKPRRKAVAAAKRASAAKAVAPPAADVAAASGAGEGGVIAPGSGLGSGGGSGAGSGSGVGSGSGHAVDLRLYCLSCPEPPYPRVARVRGWQGATDVELTVRADGRVDGATVTRSSGFDVLDRAALDVARQSRFSPPPPAFAPPVRGRLAYRFELR